MNNINKLEKKALIDKQTIMDFNKAAGIEDTGQVLPGETKVANRNRSTKITPTSSTLFVESSLVVEDETLLALKKWKIPSPVDDNDIDEIPSPVDDTNDVMDEMDFDIGGLLDEHDDDPSDGLHVPLR